MRLLVIGGSDAGIAAALRARELAPSVEAIVVVADAFPNFSICGLPYHLSGDVGDWRELANRTTATAIVWPRSCDEGVSGAEQLDRRWLRPSRVGFVSVGEPDPREPA